MKLRLTRRALGDLDNIASYLTSRNPRAASHVVAEIRVLLQLLTEHPAIGRRQTASGVRKAVTPEFGYIVYHDINEERGEIAVLTIQHGRQRRGYEDA